MAKKKSRKQIQAIHAKNNLPHTSHIEMKIKDDKGKTQGIVEMDVFGKPIPKGLKE